MSPNGTELFTDRTRRDLYVQLSRISGGTCPFGPGAGDAFGGRVQWVEPVMVGRVEYRELTGRLLHAAWKGVGVWRRRWLWCPLSCALGAPGEEVWQVSGGCGAVVGAGLSSIAWDFGTARLTSC